MGRCSTTKTAAGRTAGSPPASWVSAGRAPFEPPMMMTSWPGTSVLGSVWAARQRPPSLEHSFGGEQHERVRYLGEGQHRVDIVPADRAYRHAGIACFGRILRERHPPGLADRDEAVHAIASAPRQEQAHHSGAERLGGRLEQRIDGGPGPV